MSKKNSKLYRIYLTPRPNYEMMKFKTIDEVNNELKVIWQNIELIHEIQKQLLNAFILMGLIEVVPK